MKEYRLQDFSEEEKALAKQFIKKGILGLITVSIDEKVDDMLAQLEHKPFIKSDTIVATWELKTTGDIILAAMGAAREEINPSLSS